jgi:acetylglutamate kinase
MSRLRKPAPGGARRRSRAGAAARRRGLTVLKIGGSLFETADGGALLDRVARAWAAGGNLLVVHGGGAELSRWLERLGIPSRFLDGQRITTPEMLPVALAVLGGLINRRLVEELLRRGCPAIGVTGADGAACTARRADGGALGAVGELRGVDDRFYLDLIDARRLPVIASLAWDDEHGWLNVNADLMAAGIASGLRASRLVLMTDSGGVRGRDGGVIGSLSRAALRRLIDDGAATDGMIPKLRACESALRAGVLDIRIVGAATDLASILGGTRTAVHGTRITHDGETA